MSTIKLITPVGTSLFDNYFNDRINPDYYHQGAETVYNNLKDNNIRFGLFESQLQEYQQSLINDEEEWEGIGLLGSQVAQNWAFHNDKASAEIASILEIKRTISPNHNLDVYLLATDSVNSPLAATIIKQRFCKNRIDGISVYFDLGYKHDVPKGLQVEDEEEFREEGLQNFVGRINTITGGQYGEQVVLNITGGYKAFLPYLSIIGQIGRTPLVYLFEDSTQLIEIPQLPVDFDFSSIEDNYLVFERLRKEDQNLPTLIEFQQEGKLDNKEFEHIRKQQLIEINNDGKVHFTVLGRLLFDRYEYLFNRDTFNRQNLLSKIVELKLYEFYIERFGAERVKQGKKVGQKIVNGGFDIDVYIENPEKNMITAIEVKPGGNIPILEERFKTKEKKKQTIEHKLIQGGFDYILRNNPDKNIKLAVIVYFHKDIADGAKDQIKTLHQRYPDLTKYLSWYCLRLRSDYKKDTSWKVNEDRLQPILIEAPD